MGYSTRKVIKRAASFLDQRYIHIHTKSKYIHTYIYIQYIHIYINTQIHTYTYIHTYIYTFSLTHTYTHAYTHTHTYIHTYIYTHTHRHIHTYRQTTHMYVITVLCCTHLRKLIILYRKSAILNSITTYGIRNCIIYFHHLVRHV